MTIHPTPCHCGAFACEVRLNGGLQVKRGRTSDRPYNEASLRTPEAPTWEKQVMGERLPDGSFLPHLNENGNAIRIKEWTENRARYESALRRARTPSQPTN